MGKSSFISILFACLFSTVLAQVSLTLPGLKFDANQYVDRQIALMSSATRGVAGLFTKKSTHCGNSDSVVFWKKNGCGEKAVGSIHHGSARGRNKARDNNDFTKLDCARNDDARSLHINANLPSGAVIWVCDDSKNCYDDDFTIITLKKKVPKGDVYCVKSFERSYEDEMVKVDYRTSGNLDGKVSSAGAYY